ncbi:hypothetical protein E2C01_055304 [Portunus trituberculatus]|uniref:Uncharacterized protein n=1 Tax=Portunus trituberculatus TaxID=210409 RepID=A0A5B7GVK6_PORTR|nr:hypothetical protein [Portunus trituberculatus]
MASVTSRVSQCCHPWSAYHAHSFLHTSATAGLSCTHQPLREQATLSTSTPAFTFTPFAPPAMVSHPRETKLLPRGGKEVLRPGAL